MNTQIEKMIQDVPFSKMKYTFLESEKSVRVIRGLGHSCICSFCGKEFNMFNPTQYVYKIREHSKDVVFCRWNCMCQYRKEKEANAKRRKKS